MKSSSCAHRHRAALGLVLLLAVGEVPDQLLLLGIHADHRVHGHLAGLGVPADVAELRIPVRMLGTFNGLGVTLQAEPLFPQQAGNGAALALWHWRANSPASLRVDLVVHRSGYIGSPRSCGSTSTTSAGRSPASRSAASLRLPPGRRARPSGSAPESSSSMPQGHRGLTDPAGLGYQPDPPWPSARASAPSSSRRSCRSSRCGKIASNFAPASPG